LIGARLVRDAAGADFFSIDAAVAGEPSPRVGVLVGGVVVQDQVHPKPSVHTQGLCQTR
jgi:hypothetical protein